MEGKRTYYSTQYRLLIIHNNSPPPPKKKEKIARSIPIKILSRILHGKFIKYQIKYQKW